MEFTFRTLRIHLQLPPIFEDLVPRIPKTSTVRRGEYILSDSCIVWCSWIVVVGEYVRTVMRLHGNVDKRQCSVWNSAIFFQMSLPLQLKIQVLVIFANVWCTFGFSQLDTTMAMELPRFVNLTTIGIWCLPSTEFTPLTPFNKFCFLKQVC